MVVKLYKSAITTKSGNEATIIISENITVFYNQRTIVMNSLLELSNFIQEEGFKYESRQN